MQTWLRPAIIWMSLFLLAGVSSVSAQDGYDPSWYDSSAPYVKIAVVEDGVYSVDRSRLESAGLPSSADPATFRLLENGREIPLRYDATNERLLFVGRRNRGRDETWAYNGDPSLQSSPSLSLYSDTTFYWLTWGGTPGLRYQAGSASASNITSTVRDTLHREQDNTYFYGREPGDPRYTNGEGYYWDNYRINTAGTTLQNTYTLSIPRFDPAASDPLALTIQLMGSTGSCHRVAMEAELDDGSGPAFQTVDEVAWSFYTMATLQASVPAGEVPSDGQLRIRLTSYDTDADGNTCGPPNYVLLDWIEVAYTRQLAAESNANRQHFSVPTGSYQFELTQHDDPVTVYSPSTGRYYETTSNGSLRTFDAAPSAPAMFWAVEDDGLRAPAAVRADAPSDWANPSNAADYVILTRSALEPTAQQLADYRRSFNGFSAEVVPLQQVFDEFDYGRPTPIAIRRFVHRTQSWATPPRFLMIWADAPYPVYTERSSGQRLPSWAVPSFGYGPSDGWFAMQYEGSDDWSEILAVGRVPIRTNDEGDLFLQKIQTYESAPLEDWQKRMLMLAGGTSAGEQQTLQSFTTRWADVAAQDTLIEGMPADTTVLSAGMDTLYYFKRANDPLDTSFQDSLSVDLKRGAGWLNYFGHSAAQTWEIVTDPPSEFDNAGRLPFVVSLACKTGSFAGGRFEEKDEKSLSEALVVGSLDGSIAHWGTSELGNITPSARLNDELIDRVFRDTTRVMGTALRETKAAIATQYGQSDLYVRHLLQYGLIGDPAMTLALPTQPDLHLTPELLSTTPFAPTPGESLTLSVRLRNRGLIPADSVTAEITYQPPTGSASTITRRFPRFALEQHIDFTVPLDEQSVGPNAFRVTADPANTYAEASETNNTAETAPVVFGTGLTIVRPLDQGIVATTEPSLRFYLTSTQTEGVPVTIELDTAPTFDSSALQRDQLSASGIAFDWAPPSSLNDGQTYYWRARIDDGATEPTWTKGSFTVRTDLESDGWLQQNHQFAENPELERLTYDGQQWAFGTFDREVRASSERGGGGQKGQFTVGGTQRYERLGRGFGVLVIDDTTGRVVNHGSFCTYDVRDELLGDGRCTDDLEGSDAIAALETFIAAIEPGQHVFTRTRHLGSAGSPSTIPDAVKSLFCSLGDTGVSCDADPNATYSESIDTLTYDDLWLMQTRKGFPETTVEEVARSSASTNEITRTTRLTFPYPGGHVTTDRIGPAHVWTQIDWDAELPTESANVQIEVLGEENDTVLETFSVSDAPSPQSLTGIDADAHPYLRLRATLSDSTRYEPPQLDQWSLTYDPTTELASSPAVLQLSGDSLEVGAPLDASIAIRNLGTMPSSPVRVRYDITDASNQTVTAAIDTLTALDPGATTSSAATLSTDGRAGSNRLTVQIEQDGPPEPITFNNTLVRRFFVRADESPPVVRVLADGRELPENPEPVTNLQDPSLPFVSTQPTLEILAADNSDYFLLEDTSFVEVRFDGREIPFSSPDLTFEPATAEQNEARVIFTPHLSGQDTTHTLQVEASDASGNMLGDPYQVHFRVQQNQVIRDLYPYPNPMHTHTTFAFRVEGGAQQPEDFRLRIYTLSGRLIRAFSSADVNEGGGLRVGWNTLRWDGRDQDGDRVSTGVYLYRVSIKGEDGTFRGDVEKVAVIR